jgi:hypothetical protein
MESTFDLTFETRDLVALCPAAHPQARANFSATVINSIPLDQIKVPPLVVGSVVAERLMKIGDTSVRAWGVSSKHKQTWERVQLGTVFLFSRFNKIVGSARAVGKAESPSLAGSLWQSGEWPCVFFLDDYMELDIPLEETNAVMKAHPAFCVRRFQLLNDDKSKAIANLLIRKLQMA